MENNIEFIDKGYARIYIDRNSNADLENLEEYLSENIANVYFNKSEPHLQWNYYWIFETQDISIENALRFSKNDSYCRVYITSSYENSRLPSLFPDYNPETAGKIILVQEEYFNEKRNYVLSELLYNGTYDMGIIPSDMSSRFGELEQLQLLDMFRMQCINGKSFIAPVSRKDDYTLYKHKFAFLGDKLKEVLPKT